MRQGYSQHKQGYAGVRLHVCKQKRPFSRGEKKNLFTYQRVLNRKLYSKKMIKEESFKFFFE